ncbi:LysR family transcriptional regulator [Reyranella sp.]|uniref:LysR family transcriptional regulator n=1 Tax=Reyranella sp. TaxID=1929291 RepID=UPI0037845296
MNWDHLRVFLTVARSGQILSAARHLKLDHATVSRRLAALEGELGARLVDRTPAGCVLTQAGQQLFQTAERMESEMLHVQSSLGDSDDAVSGVTRIGAPDGFGIYFLAPQLAPLVDRYPALTIRLVPLPRNFSVSKREVDIAITLDRPQDGRLICQKVVDYRLRLYASSAYLARKPMLRTPDDLQAHTLVTTLSDILWSPTIDFFGSQTIFWRSRFECANLVGQFEAVKCGIGVAVLPDFVASPVPDLQIVLPEMSFMRTYWMVSHPDSQRIKRISIVRSAIIEKARQMRRLFAGGTTARGSVK